MATRKLHVRATPERLYEDAAEHILALSEARVREAGRFTIALAGGATPRGLHEVLVSQPYRQSIEWPTWRVFWGDERCVPPDHPDSNFRMARESLLDHVPIPNDQVHRMRGEEDPDEAAREYEDTLARVLATVGMSFDLILLGVGDDGHTASLFPGTKALDEAERLVVANWVPHLEAYRLTFTLKLLNQAREVLFLVTGASKAKVLKEVLEPETGVALLPAARVHPANGLVSWYVSQDAASQVTTARV